MVARALRAGCELRAFVPGSRPYFRGSYTIARPISLEPRSAQVRSPPDSTPKAPAWASDTTARNGPRSQRTSTGHGRPALLANKVLLATVGYGWSGRKWFTTATVGAALRPFRAADRRAIDYASTAGCRRSFTAAPLATSFEPQTLLVEYSRAPHDEYGHGGRNTATGFKGNVQSVVGSWSWSLAARRWTGAVRFLHGPAAREFLVHLRVALDGRRRASACDRTSS